MSPIVWKCFGEQTLAKVDGTALVLVIGAFGQAVFIHSFFLGTGK